MTEISRRHLLLLASANAAMAMAAPAIASESGISQTVVRRNASGFRPVRWRDQFDSLRHGAIVCDTRSKALHYWSEDGVIELMYPCSVPMSEDLTRRGRTEITLKRRDPVWIPTPSMRERNPDLPARVEAGPKNPMGTRALNLTWQYYRIHGIDNPAKIGRAASNGCFGLYNHQVEELFELVRVGTQVVVI
ncbi:L,D-transpeptidase [Roseovarius sp. MS2]|uniref:L,D-transpeptidase n=1 Tax=Roseovarius sp. MS2 TaxID=3390728 RepID=UPI003EDC2D59